MQSLLIVALTASASAIHAPDRRRLGGRRAIMPSFKDDDLLAAKVKPKPPGILTAAYGACGAATMGAWTAVVWTTIRSNQPVGAMMPSVQHGIFARAGVLSAIPLIASR